MRTSDRLSTYPVSDNDEVSVVTWNLLAPCYDRYGVDWNATRLPEMKRWLERLAGCDVMCFQEVDLKNSLAGISEVLVSNGFTAVVQERRGFPVVNATFFRASRLRLSWTQHRSRALLVGLALQDGLEFCVANVHLEAGGDERNEKQRAAQLASVLKRTSGSTIICGDFNSSLTQESLLRAQMVNDGFVRTPTKGITIAQADTGYADVLDHIWASQDFKVRLVLSSSPGDLAMLQAAGMPNETYPSDHLPVAATYSYKQRKGNGKQLNEMPIVGVPTSLVEEMRREWVQICWHAKIGGDKREAREQKKLESAFLELLSSDEAMALRQWRDSANKAAKKLVAAAVDAAVVTLRAADSVPSAAEKPIDRGKLPSNATRLGGC